MQQRNVGHSGLIVSELSLGAMLFGDSSERGTSPDTAARMIHAYIERGGTHIDTANVYADGRSEEIIGEALKNGKRENVTIATKVRFGREHAGLSRRVIMQEVEKSLRRLQTDVIDLYYMHGWDLETPIEESLRAFDDLVTAGKVRYIGVSNFKAWQVMQSLALSDAHNRVRFIAAQYQYSLIVRDIEYEFSDLCASEGVGIMPWGPLGGGFLSGKYKRGERPQQGRIAGSEEKQEEYWERRSTERNWNIIDAVGEVAESRGVSYAQVALAWLRTRPQVSSVIIGARTMEQFEDNMAAAELDLTIEEREKLGEASQLPELYPYRMMREYGLS